MQAFVLDALSPLTAIVENGDRMSREDVHIAALTVVELIGNAIAQISRMWREKIISSVEKSLIPLTKQEESFSEAPPDIFGNGFAKKSKEFLDQLKAIRSTLPPSTKSNSQDTRKIFFAGPLFSKGGTPSPEVGGGPICIQTNTPVSTLLQLVARSLCKSHRCLPAGLVGSEGIHQPTMEPDCQSTGKDAEQRAHIILIAPVWKAQPWYPRLLAMLVDLPRLLPCQVGVVAHLEPQLAVWNISGRYSETSNFLLGLRNSSSNHGGL